MFLALSPPLFRASTRETKPMRSTERAVCDGALVRPDQWRHDHRCLDQARCRSIGLGLAWSLPAGTVATSPAWAIRREANSATLGMTPPRVTTGNRDCFQLPTSGTSWPSWWNRRRRPCIWIVVLVCSPQSIPLTMEPQHGVACGLVPIRTAVVITRAAWMTWRFTPPPCPPTRLKISVRPELMASTPRPGLYRWKGTERRRLECCGQLE